MTLKDGNELPYEEDFLEENPFEEFEEEDKNITRGELKEILDVPGDDDVKEGQYYDFSYKGIGPKEAEEIANHLKFDGIKGVTIDLSDNWIGDTLMYNLSDDGVGTEWVYEFAGKNLGEGATLNLRNNSIFGMFAAALIFELGFSKKSTLDLENNHIDDDDLQDYLDGEGYFHTILPEGAKINLSNNYIGDKGADILMSHITLKEGSILDVSRNNRISDKMKENLKKWEKDYHDEGINCTVII